ncbi:MAG TPA: acetylglutamate kinase [Polyangia bacterium]
MTITTTGAPASGIQHVIKLGGDVLEGAPLAALVRSVAEVQASGARGVIVHGGGAQVTELSTRLGLATRMVAGRRITDAPTLDVMKMVVAGRLNLDLCAALQAGGVRAVGLHAGSGSIRATRRPPRLTAGAGDVPIDFGLVGDVAGFDLALLRTLADAGRLPVLSCLGLEVVEGEGDAPARSTGQTLNLNADLIASQLAAAAGAEVLVAVTAVGGVRREIADPSSRIAHLTSDEARAAIADGIVKGGMIAKLDEAMSALAQGVRRVAIVAPHEIRAALDAPGTVGTTLVAGAPRSPAAP